ncbi:hypothetical protein D3C86_2141540 [compost metagenome]
MRNYTGGNKELAFGIVINAPWITESVRYDFKLLFCWMVPPHPAIDIDAIFHLDIFGKCVVVFV